MVRVVYCDNCGLEYDGDTYCETCYTKAAKRIEELETENIGLTLNIKSLTKKKKVNTEINPKNTE